MSNDLDPRKSAQALYAKALVRERIRAGLTQTELAAHPKVMVSSQTIGHIENCRRPPTLRLSKGFDAAMNLEEFMESMYGAYEREVGAPPDFWEYAELEPRANKIRSYSAVMIPGLLQDPTYIRHMLSAVLKPDALDEFVATRAERQELLRREDPPELFNYIDEFALLRTVGDEAVRKAQFNHLLALMENPRFHIRVVPDGVDIYPGGSFTILSFPENRPESSPDIAYVEGPEDLGRILEPGSKVANLALVFERLGSFALPVKDSARMIRAHLEKMR